MVMAIDPGRCKSGIVVMNKNFDILFQKVIESLTMESVILELFDKFKFETVILGNGTTSKEVKQMISSIVPDIHIEIVEESYTTEEARKLYWKKNPPRGWRRFLPTSMQVPPVPVDDLVAEILAKRYINAKCIMLNA